ncbi:MAG: hypothetical protein O3C57_00145 [Verrucomicrobia bacterium]|nr:hypothetical protein [Verrucomicrobiota bacterium]
MTIRDSINLVLARIRREQYLAAALLFPAFIISAFAPIAGWLVLPAVVLIGHAFWRVRRQIRCTACHKSLGHLMLDANITRNNYAVLLCPVQFPAQVKTCPACGAGLDAALKT